MCFVDGWSLSLPNGRTCPTRFTNRVLVEASFDAPEHDFQRHFGPFMVFWFPQSCPVMENYMLARAGLTRFCRTPSSGRTCRRAQPYIFVPCEEGEWVSEERRGPLAS